MKLFLALIGLLVALLVSWLYFALPVSRALTGTTIYLPLAMKGSWMEEVAIVRRDGHQAVYWPAPLPSNPPYYYFTPTPTPPTTTGPGIPIYLEVENHTARNIAWVKVEFSAFDSAGAPITLTVSQAPTLLDVLRPGQRSPVALNIPFPGGYQAFRAASKGFTVSGDWGFTDWDTQAGLELVWSSPWYPPPPYPTPAPAVPVPPNIYGWVKNTGTMPLPGVTVVVTIRGNDQASGLVLDATRVPIAYAIAPGSYAGFNAYLNRDYGTLFGGVEAVAQRSLDIPGILEKGSVVE